MNERKVKDFIPPGVFGGGMFNVGGVGGAFLGNVVGGDANGAN